MTSPTRLIPATAVHLLPVSLDGDLVIDFRNRDPDDPDVYLPYPDGTLGIFTIYADRKTPGAQPIVIEAEPDGPHCVVKVDGTVLNAVQNRTLWGFRLRYPDSDLVDGYDKPIAAGEIERVDGKSS